FFTEIRAIRSMEALRRLDRVTARVRRDGRPREVAAEEIVPGDVVLLEAGDLVPADLRLVEASRLQVDESALTGESVPVGKTIEPIQGEPPLAERANMAYKGTSVTLGAGAGVAVGTGMDPEIGRISAMVEAAKEEATPLEKRLDQLGRQLLIATLAIAALTSLAGMVAGRDVMLMVATGIALVVAAVPEGLPVGASIALARGMWRMARRNALIERLSAVETLGSVTVICSDKTGTLTENRMTVSRLALPGGDVEFAEGGDRPAAGEGSLRAALEVAVLCNAARLEGGGGEGDRPGGVGDPMEVALLAAGAAAGLARDGLLAAMPEVRREEFDPAVKMMASCHRTADGGLLVAVKGAPEAVLTACVRVLTDGGEVELDEAGRGRWHERNEQLARGGLRALALARKMASSEAEAPFEGLTLVGLVGLLDPPREDARPAVRACRDAGIRVAMITGDQPATARAIAHAVGLIDERDAGVVHGGELKPPGEMSPDEQREVLDAAVFARMDPKQKLDLIELYQKHGHRVAMTGDGVNDATALKKADIGIAMGRRGTQVAREAADMVLLDDAFASIVAAIEQGRMIFGNIRRFIVYLLSGNAGEIMAIGAVALVNAPLPLLPLQILYINIISDVFPALALGVGKGDPDSMRRPPRDPKEAILTRQHWYAIGGYGLVIAASALLAFALAFRWLGLDTTGAVTVSFLTFGFARLWHVFNMRDPGSSPFVNNVTTNPLAWGAIAVGLVLLLAGLYVPFLAELLEVRAPGADGWALILGASLIPLAVGQLVKLRGVRAVIPGRLLPETSA
ncbi:MAG TPA: cation-transporting P-type ATPase, partial [Geminicoccaceae bacterium]|nr:cation-transporting P-type ATPase [Geminicoccaceae bacterium]